MKIKSANNEYLEKVAKLTEEEGERLLSRMRGKLTRRFEDEKLSRVEAIAIQLELDDEQLTEWRQRMHEIKARDKSKK
ncbi:MAG: hypothetical protein Q8S46_08595 [Methylotenera sp.]|nr:hypothetical protein [Methylotenera sp.]MDO9232439.1 hypothetical protein [Methylotenera sp.]MDO9389961.1 hypothetical protein [Methylotenera sp.]MDP2403425.1 hypothetical protein [Methylotenera sp.]MDP3095601.1 hypothetical protein [Methylotenera sp.]